MHSVIGSSDYSTVVVRLRLWAFGVTGIWIKAFAFPTPAQYDPKLSIAWSVPL
ncbi:hypothetical protein BO70DRAFT_366782 [Aspergillus heteromorphus CBS 117.55]|uniref:Uncharacterized protein n=1 Tax=Aspergillus heteromorphus CBS 117.55 TaxID=1448321 RepID=A0A317UWC4_9EURO|nr:uncharacterized protein BO70DRAFT_366782 [Aspergillus heteromorphus CBS 117.55]PWY65338.1 hypothetical protein BO70DRAFT_366782 [Aspergillus heteromorphus CBS 117.55]